MMRRRIRRVVGCAVISFCLFASGLTASAQGSSNYVINMEGKRQEIPLCYLADTTYSYFELDADIMSAPTDLYIDIKDQLYILDAGNGRVIKLDKDGKLLREYKPEGNDAFPKANGIFVDDEENIWIADTERGRVLRMNAEGEITLELTKPESRLYDDTYPFKPVKVEVDSMGQIYILNDLDYHGFIILDTDNVFRGYLGATRLSQSFFDSIIYMFASASQREKLGKRMPPTHTNFTIGSDNSLYTVTGNTDVEQFKLFSSTGSNYYPKKDMFGDNETDYIMHKYGKTMDKPAFVDVSVDSRGIISLLDNLSGRIYQYDQDGTMLCVFGGTGNWGSRFMNAVALEQDSAGNLYILDKNLATVQVFRPTRFTKTIQQALTLYNNGKYVEAQDSWREILISDPAYPVAHIGMGKAALKQGDYEQSMSHYKTAGDKYGYSDAFTKHFKIILQKYFLLILVGMLALIVGLIMGVGRLRRRAKRLASGR